MKVRTLIADDEELGRERLVRLLTAQPEIELVAQCGDGAQAVGAIQEHKPDLIFLDIQMPELDGFAVLDAINVDPMPVIVFVTAHDKFALKAFEVHAVDYLLKPFDRERFQSALNRALEQVKHRERGNTEQSEAQTAALAEALSPPSKPIERLAIKSDGKITLVKTSEISWLQAAHNYVEIHEDKKTHLLRGTITAIETRLPAEKFVRISRSVIVNVDRVKELQPQFYGDYTVTLHDGTKLTLSRRYRSKLPQLGVG
jgi:two-component system, LytTR family, response regulator